MEPSQIIPGKKYRIVFNGIEYAATAVKSRGDSRWPVMRTLDQDFTIRIEDVIEAIEEAEETDVKISSTRDHEDSSSGGISST